MFIKKGNDLVNKFSEIKVLGTEIFRSPGFGEALNIRFENILPGFSVGYSDGFYKDFLLGITRIFCITRIFFITNWYIKRFKMLNTSLRRLLVRSLGLGYRFRYGDAGSTPTM